MAGSFIMRSSLERWSSGKAVNRVRKTVNMKPGVSDEKYKEEDGGHDLFRQGRHQEKIRCNEQEALNRADKRKEGHRA